MTDSDYSMIQLLLIIAVLLLGMLMFFYRQDVNAQGLSFREYVRQCWNHMKEYGAFDGSNSFFVVAATHMVILSIGIVVLKLILIFIGEGNG